MLVDTVVVNTGFKFQKVKKEHTTERKGTWNAAVNCG